MKVLNALAAAVLMATACDDPSIPLGGDPGGLGIAQLEIGPDPLILMPGDTVQLTAVARSSTGAIIPNPPITWRSSDITAVTVTPSGQATALRAADSVRITARADGTSASFEPHLCKDLAYSTKGNFRLYAWAGGFEQGYFNGTHVLHSAGVMYGTNPTDLVVAMSPNGAFNHATSSPTCHLQLPAGRYGRVRIVLRKNIAGEPITNSPVAATLEIFEPADPLARDVLLVRYSFRNTTTERVDNFRVGVWFDWDLYFDPSLGVGKNYTTFNAATGIAEAFEAASATEGFAGFGGIGWIDTPFTSYRPVARNEDLRTATDHFRLLTPGMITGVAGPEDIRFITGFGPFDLAAGQSKSFMIVMAAGRTREEFERRISIGRSAASLFPSVAAPLQ